MSHLLIYEQNIKRRLSTERYFTHFMQKIETTKIVKYCLARVHHYIHYSPSSKKKQL